MAIDQRLAYTKMYRIRRFEETLLQLFSENKLQGTTHTSIGQEADAVSVMNQVTEADFVFSNHRCHGQFLAYSDNPKILLSEIMGRVSGMCRGRGGSQHICYKHFYTNGIQGGIVPNATGLAFAEKLKGGDGIAVVFLGDGTLGQGVVYEAMNMASLYEIPVLYLVEDNAYAMTTKTSEGVSGTIVGRAEAFGIVSSEITSNDVEELDAELEKAFSYVRNERKPYMQVIHTYRLGPHSKGDDFRDPEEVASWKLQDPLTLLAAKMDGDLVNEIQASVEAELKEAVAFAEAQPIDTDPDMYEEVFLNRRNDYPSLLNQDKSKCLDKLQAGLDHVMADFEEVILLGEDIRDPYGGAFKVTKGLTSKYDSRIINTPISEAGFIGMSVGLAMNGRKPISEMMFGDFITLGFDQLLNHATKFSWMYAGQIQVPMLIRIPSGGGRGYGATHSQSLEKYLIGIPNLRVIALNRLVDAGALLYRVVENLTQPTVFIENKKMYGEKLYQTLDGKADLFSVTESEGAYPVYHLTLAEGEMAEATIVTYGPMLDLAMEAAKKLMLTEEMVVNIICHTSISPLDLDAMQAMLGDCKHVITLEEGNERGGWGAEVIAALTERATNVRYHRVAAKNCVIPCGAELEKGMLPTVDAVITAVMR